MTQNNTKVDLLVILGKQLYKDGTMHDDLIDRLNAAIEYVNLHPQTDILVSGKYGREYDEQGFTPSYYECDVMYDYLASNGIAKKQIHKESESKDTISNITCTNSFLNAHPYYQNIMIVCASHHQPRIKVLVGMYLDAKYAVSYLTIEANPTPDQLSLEKREISRLVTVK